MVCSDADDPHSYWTGYFTSRPLVKVGNPVLNTRLVLHVCVVLVVENQGYVRSSSAYLQVARQMEAYIGGPQPKSQLLQFEQALGVAQHHDAVSGTEKQVCRPRTWLFEWVRLVFSAFDFEIPARCVRLCEATRSGHGSGQ